MVLPTPTRQYTFLASMLTLTVTVFGVCERGIEREKERKIEIERISKGGRENSVCVRVTERERTREKDRAVGVGACVRV